MEDGFRINSRTLGSGAGGLVDVRADGPIAMSGTETTMITSSAPPPPAGLDQFASLFNNFFGEELDFDSLAAKTGIPNAGLFDVFAFLNGLNIPGDGTPLIPGPLTAGNGGIVSVTTPKLTMQAGAHIAADSLWENPLTAGNTGSIMITANNSITLSNSTISTRAIVADGGNIKLTAPNIVQLTNSEITTSVGTGTGAGGNIDIDPEFVILNNSDILANAFGGPGGNITIIADNVINSAQSRIDASSALGINGTVNISNPDQEVAQELAVLPENFLDVTGLISDRCGTAAGTSSLVSAGPGGLAVDPDGYLPSFGAMTNAVYNGNGENSAINSGKPWWALAVDTSALQLAQVTCTR
jgi:large exoprotein involved in heme utilization and adhesion